MLSQRTLHLLEANTLLGFQVGNHVDKVCLLRRRRGVRVQAGFLKQDDVKIAGGAAGIVSRLQKVSLRPPAPLPEGSRSDDEQGVHDADSPAPVEGPQPVLQDRGKRDATSLERFTRARAAGRELVERTRRGEALPGREEEVYYKPRVGEYVMGVVVSGTLSKLDVDIGAKHLGHLFRKDAMPLDKCSLREMMCGDSPHGPRFVREDGDDEEEAVEELAPMGVEPGVVLTMQVKEMTPSGRALLSARSVAREYAWQRVRQLLDCNAVFEVEITEWTSAGLVSRVEGLRAFLPIYYLVDQAPEPATAGSVCYKQYVGQKFTVMINSVDETRSNLVISEKKAWMTKNAYIGALVDGIVTEIEPYGVHIRMKDTGMSGLLHISNISRARVKNIASVFSIGEEVKVMVVPSSKQNRLSFSTVEMESQHGLILRDKEAVFEDGVSIAAEIAEAYRRKQSEDTPDRNDTADLGQKTRVIANWDWLEFGEDETEENPSNRYDQLKESVRVLRQQVRKTPRPVSAPSRKGIEAPSDGHHGSSLLEEINPQESFSMQHLRLQFKIELQKKREEIKKLVASQRGKSQQMENLQNEHKVQRRKLEARMLNQSEKIFALEAQLSNRITLHRQELQAQAYGFAAKLRECENEKCQQIAAVKVEHVAAVASAKEHHHAELSQAQVIYVLCLKRAEDAEAKLKTLQEELVSMNQRMTNTHHETVELFMKKDEDCSLKMDRMKAAYEDQIHDLRARLKKEKDELERLKEDLIKQHTLEMQSYKMQKAREIDQVSERVRAAMERKDACIALLKEELAKQQEEASSLLD